MISRRGLLSGFVGAAASIPAAALTPSQVVPVQSDEAAKQDMLKEFAYMSGVGFLISANYAREKLEIPQLDPADFK